MKTFLPKTHFSFKADDSAHKRVMITMRLYTTTCHWMSTPYF